MAVRQPPLLPDFPEVDCGLPLGGGGGATCDGFVPSFLSGRCDLSRFDEKSGIPRGDFRFMPCLAGKSLSNCCWKISPTRGQLNRVVLHNASPATERMTTITAESSPTHAQLTAICGALAITAKPAMIAVAVPTMTQSSHVRCTAVPAALPPARRARV